MRVLVVASGAEFTPSVELMVQLAVSLSTRGHVVAIACAAGSASDAAIEQRWPRLSVRSVTGRGWFRQGLSVRGTVAALRPDALLVGSLHDAVLAAYAAGKRGAIVRLFGAHELESTVSDDAAPDLPWRARYALSRSRITPWGDTQLVVSWPDDTAAASVTETVPRLAVPSPQLLLLPAAQHDENTAIALRAAAHLRSRFETLQVTLLGDVAALQSTRLHAASLNLTPCLSIAPLSALLHHELRHATAAWVAASGDLGAIGTLAAMQQALPVVVSHDAVSAALVAPAITGLLSSPDSVVTTVAELARLMSDASLRQAMGDAATARAAREYGWDGFVTTAETLLARTTGLTSER